MDLVGGGLGGIGGSIGGSTFGPAELSSSAQDTSADSNVFNTQGPSANHGSISFNFHVNNENFSTPLGNSRGDLLVNRRTTYFNKMSSSDELLVR